jgi:hypothetical protein
VKRDDALLLIMMAVALMLVLPGMRTPAERANRSSAAILVARALPEQ